MKAKKDIRLLVLHEVLRMAKMITCVYSAEEPVYPTADGGTCAIPDSETTLNLIAEQVWDLFHTSLPFLVLQPRVTL